MTLLLACILSVHDGDTVACNHERIRLAAIDAPELRGSPRCEPRRRKQLTHGRNPAWCDYKLGIASRDALRGFLRGGRVRIDRTGIDVYGRTLARLTVNGVDAGDYLISRGLARRWN